MLESFKYSLLILPEDTYEDVWSKIKLVKSLMAANHSRPIKIEIESVDNGPGTDGTIPQSALGVTSD